MTTGDDTGEGENVKAWPPPLPATNGEAKLGATRGPADVAAGRPPGSPSATWTAPGEDLAGGVAGRSGETDPPALSAPRGPSAASVQTPAGPSVAGDAPGD
jgi:hypothetical protein